MRRSLVGSEMCIRDSREDGPLGAIVAGGRHGRRLDFPDARIRRWRARRPCLLYTSDAAEDLPCVDLGGRRLIKKKKKPTTRFLHTVTTPTHYSTDIEHTPI